ncbi:Hypothetical predicted protein [Pelobates cultripes]|uniref:VWFA domain-containing protein n=2 Tax=Pelobates cultripes TaxID=61616 RepID=A0AAD1VPR5_PELCU|nr:Hypothetical predicted protein [Pelobates cultripes]
MGCQSSLPSSIRFRGHTAPPPPRVTPTVTAPPTGCPERGVRGEPRVSPGGREDGGRCARVSQDLTLTPPSPQHGGCSLSHGMAARARMLPKKTKLSSRKMASEVELDSLVSSSTWLQSHGLRKKKLTLQKILAQLGFQHKEEYVNNLGRPVSSRYAEGLFHQYHSDGKIYNLTAKREHVLQKIESITEAIEMYKQRLFWLASGSRAIFGVIQEQTIIFILGMHSVSKEQYDLCRNDFCLVLQEQVRHVKRFNLIWVSKVPLKWHQKTVLATQKSIEEAVEWVLNLPYPPDENVDCTTKAFSKALNEQVESIYLFTVGDIPDGKRLLLSQRISKCPCPIHVVSYNPQKSETIEFWKKLSHQSLGRFHVYSEQNKNNITSSTQGEEYSDIKPIEEESLPELDLREDELLISNELIEAQNVVEKLQDILKTCYASEDEKKNQSIPEPSPEDCVSSKVWLQKYGLKAQKLQFYDALADCAFRHSDGVVDIKIKPEDESVQTDAENKIKRINAKYCDRFVHALWKDGSVVHLFVSKEKCRWCEEKMRSALELMEKRVNWLRNGSRELFGSILEDQIYILIDTSHSMKDKLYLVKEKLFQLMQEQLRHKRMFNFVKFDSKVEAWKSKLADVNENSLNEAWIWVNELQVGGSTNTMEALQVAIADNNTQAVYLLTDGRPDQPTHTILDQVNCQKQVPVHTISFNCADTEANSFLHQLSNETGGRFHCYNSYQKDPEAPQPFVSDDIKLILSEIETGKADLEKIQKIHTECLMLDWYHNGEKDHSHVPYKLHYNRTQEKSQSTASPLPHTHNLLPPRLLQRKKAHHAAQTKSSVLRALSHGVKFGESLMKEDMPLETKDLFLNNDKKATAVLREFTMIDDVTEKEKKKVKRLPKDDLDISSARWLKKHGLVARKLTIMDVLGPTTVPHTAKYVPILDKHVLSKVFDECLMRTDLSRIHVSTIKRLLTYGRAAALDDLIHNLFSWDDMLVPFNLAGTRLNLVIWRALSQEERDKFERDTPVPYLENKEALLQALDRLGWPIPVDNVMLLEEEIEAGKQYLQQASELQDSSKKNAVMANLEKRVSMTIIHLQYYAF